MAASPTPEPRRTETRLVLLGAGHAHVEVLRRFARRPERVLRLTVIAREPHTPYSGLLPGVIRGEYAPADALVALGPLAAAAGARLVVAEAIAIDLGARRVVLDGADPVDFDLLSLDVGGEPMMPREARGSGAVPVKPIGRFLDRLAALEAALPAQARIAVVGDGAGGTELVLALARRFAGRARLLLIGAGAEPLAEAPARARRAARAALAAAGVAIRSGVRAGRLAEGRLALSDGTVEEADLALWATGVAGPGFLARAGLRCDAAGCVLVADTLQSLSHAFVFAAGDCAAIADAPRPKAGVWAVRAGPVLAANLRRAVRGEPLRDWRPQRRALAILGLGGGRAIAWRGRWSLSGCIAARWKTWLDVRWIARYR
jgi:selenide, water dikinase